VLIRSTAIVNASRIESARAHKGERRMARSLTEALRLAEKRASDTLFWDVLDEIEDELAGVLTSDDPVVLATRVRDIMERARAAHSHIVSTAMTDYNRKQEKDRAKSTSRRAKPTARKG
jgi:hypothetical protein